MTDKHVYVCEITIGATAALYCYFRVVGRILETHFVTATDVVRL